MSDSSTIEIQQVERFRTSDGILCYDVGYTNPQNGKPHMHRIPVEAIGTRMELLGLTRDEVLELVINEAHAPSDDVDFMYRTSIERKREAIQRAARECRAQRRPWRRRLDIESDAFTSAAPDRRHVDHVRKYRRVHTNAGWNDMASWLETDREEIDLHAAWYIAHHIITVEIQEDTVSSSS